MTTLADAVPYHKSLHQAQKENMENLKQYADLEKAKMEAEAQWQQFNNPLDPTLCGGALGSASVGQGLCGQPGIRERVAQNLSRAQQEARRADALCELQRLFEKHPDVARILDLLETAQLIRP